MDWFGGQGTKPDTGEYIGVNGFVTDIINATDVRGEQGLRGLQGPVGPAGSFLGVQFIAETPYGGSTVLTAIDSVKYLALVARYVGSTPILGSTRIYYGEFPAMSSGTFDLDNLANANGGFSQSGYVRYTKTGALTFTFHSTNLVGVTDSTLYGIRGT